MKTVLEQLMEVNEKLAAIEKLVCGDNSEEFTPCCTDECTCEEPEFDSAGFSEADREPEPELEQIITFTKEELIILAAKLMERAISTAKEAVTDTDLDADNLVSLDLGYSYQIDIELDKDQIVKSIHDEIDNTIELDNDSVEDELYDILREMEKLS
jgi:hypothetical protein